MLFLMLALAGPAHAQQERRYRVELLVLRHLDSDAEARIEPGMRDFSEALDLVPRPQAETGGAEAEGPTADVTAQASPEAARRSAETAAGEHAAAGAADEGTPPTDAAPEAAAAGIEPKPPPPIWHDKPGDTMQEVWRRLRLSAGFRPELYFSWEQPGSEPFPLIRVHDERLVFVDDPWAELRNGASPTATDGSPLPATGLSASLPVSDLRMPAAPPAAVTGSEATVVDSEPAAVTEEAANTGASDESGEPAAALPEPVRYYHIDGTARLRRSRFLHLELDLDWRDAEGPTNAPTDLAATPTGPAAEPAYPRRPEVVRVHRLQQSRQIHTGDLTYFDGPFIGVLALVTRIEVPDTAADAEPDPR